MLLAVACLKFAVTVVSAVILTVQVSEVPRQAPGAAVSVTAVPDLKGSASRVCVDLTIAVQLDNQFVGSGSRGCDNSAEVGGIGGIGSHCAMQVGAVPAQAPVQPVKGFPAAGVAVIVT